ncbi:hypothetical protein HMPREF1042_2503 [Streptococcus constellatus subsp. pharyngis SK1060 = CCUG 46377]|uniref:Uncharacterized protein n=1 Tax=Streptococcus constellatus subsp. pharyngis SK1060 = CCUG 46377 TaxID=1035184 RepID=F9PA03_STRCV|nr:hypothetical protein HMPREF1042_2503 [Streptococcus constellatus subsp. pharyngis SK1060 = CCUG 46377]
MDRRIFVEKKANFSIKSESLVKELTHNLQLTSLKILRIVQVYDIFNLEESLFARAQKHIFSEQVTDTILDEATVQADLNSHAFLLLKLCRVSLTNGQQVHKRLCSYLAVTAT